MVNCVTYLNCPSMWYLLIFLFFLQGCRSKAYSNAYNMHAGTELLMRYDPAAKKVVVIAEASGTKKFAKLKFSPPPNKLKSFAGKEDPSRACVSKLNLGYSVMKTIDEWVDDIALEKSSTNVEIPPKILHFKVKSEVDDQETEIPIKVTMTQSADRWTIIIRHEGVKVKDMDKPLATVILDRAGRTESISKWRADINQAVSGIMHTRNILMSCILSANR